MLSYSGHIASLVNPPGNPKAHYWTGGAPGPDPQKWLAEATKHQGSWWEAWTEWFEPHGGEQKQAPRSLGSKAHPVVDPAPGPLRAQLRRAARRDRPARAGVVRRRRLRRPVRRRARSSPRLVGAELARRGLREPEVVAGTLRRQRHTASLLMAAAGYAGPCGTDKRWDEFDHLALLHRYVEPARIEPALQDSRVFQRLLDEALEAWSRDGGWAALHRRRARRAARRGGAGCRRGATRSSSAPAG